MSNIKINLSEFKHVKSNDKSTTLRHKHGHEITLAHTALSKPNQEALKALASSAATDDQHRESKTDGLAEGGKVKKQHKPSKPIPNTENQPVMKAEGGDVQAEKPSMLENFGQRVGNAMTGRGFQTDEQYYNDPAVKTALEVGIPIAEGGKVPRFCAYCGDMAHGGECQQDRQKLAEGTPDEPVKAAEYDIEHLGEINNPPEGVPPAALEPLESDKTKDITQYHGPYDPTARYGMPGTVEAAKLRHNISQILTPISQRQQFEAPPGEKPMENQEPQVEMPSQPSAEQSPLPSIQSLIPQSAQPQASQQPSNAADYGLRQQLKGIAQQGAATKALAAEQQQALDRRAEAANKATEAFQANLQELRAEREAHIKDIQEGHINPDQYWEGDAQGNGSHSRLMAGLGMLLAGFNPTGNPNAAIDFVNKQIDRNIQAQKANLESKQNLYRFNLEQFRNEKDAADMTRLMQSDALQHQLESLKNKYTGQYAQAEINKLQGALHQQYAPLEMQMSMRKAMMQLANDPNGQSPDAIEHMISSIEAVDPSKGKELRERFVPGIGLAKVSLPAGVRDELRAHSALDAAVKDLYNYSKTHTNLVPGTAEYNYGATKALALQQTIREGLLGGVFKEGEKPLLEKFVNENPSGAFKALTTQPRLKAVLDSNEIKLKGLKQTYGIPTGPQHSAVPRASSKEAALQWAKANPKDPRAAKILKLGGQ